MKKFNGFALFLMVLVIIFGACGDDAQEKPVETKETSTTAAEDEGVVVAKAILKTFDLAVDEVYTLVMDKPEAEKVKSQLKKVILDYTQKMQELNKKYLALKDKDIRLFGSANSFLGENRGKHVFKQNQKMDEIRYHYQQQKDEEMEKLVHGELINLLDIAVKR
jgi:hypothetical protein